MPKTRTWQRLSGYATLALRARSPSRESLPPSLAIPTTTIATSLPSRLSPPSTSANLSANHSSRTPPSPSPSTPHCRTASPMSGTLKWATATPRTMTETETASQDTVVTRTWTLGLGRTTLMMTMTVSLAEWRSKFLFILFLAPSLPLWSLLDVFLCFLSK